MVVLPIKQAVSPRFTYAVELNAVVFNFLFNWNERAGAWYMSISDKEEVLLISGIKIVSNYSLLKQFSAYSELPQGILMVIDTEANPVTANIGFDDFGTRYKLVFYTFAEAA